MKSVKPKILVFCDYYLPGYKSGGGMRTIVNMVERLHQQFDYFIVTRDHDGREDFVSYNNVKLNDWNNLDNAQVFYLTKSEINISSIKKSIQKVNPDAIYLNSFFSTPTIFVLLLKRLGKISNINIILAPCGELTEGSLNLKRHKKKIYRFFANALGLYNTLIWKASSEFEVKEIESAKGKGGKIFIAPDLPSKSILPNYNQSEKRIKKSGALHLVFLSRISEKKNLKWFLERLMQIKENIHFDIIGPIEDDNYWKQCSKIISSFESNIKCNYLGSIPNNMVCQKMVEYDFFVLPTLSENFGHVFLEALSAGCPLITTDRTPWLKLEEKNIGWDIPLENPDSWDTIIRKCVEMDNNEYAKLSAASRKFATDWLADKNIEKATEIILQYAVNQ